jgi:hypothetical protein
MSTTKGFGFLFMLFFICLNVRAAVDLSAREILDGSQEALAKEPFISRTDISEQNSVINIGGRTISQPVRTENIIEIDRDNNIIRQSGKQNGEELIMVRQGDHAVMKLGATPWKLPDGPYGTMAKDLGSLNVCEIEAPELKENAVRWRIAGTESVDGIEAVVVESEGNSAAPLAESRMNKGIERTFPLSESGRRPSAKVLEYSSRIWIERSGNRPLRAVQTSRIRMTVPMSESEDQVIESSGAATSQYSYKRTVIDVPEDAKKILSPK